MHKYDNVLHNAQWLTILPEDDEKTRTKKKKLIKSYKSKMRFAKLDQETKVGVHAECHEDIVWR